MKLVPVFAVCFFTGGVAFGQGETELIQWGRAESAPAASGFTISGRVIPKDGAMNVISARVQGRVLSILRREGEAVAASTPIFQISSGECSSLIAEKRVAEKRGAEELIESARKRETELGLMIRNGDCFLVSSMAGVLTKRAVETGAAFNPGDNLVSVLDMKRLGVELDIPERDLSRVRPGLEAQVRLASDPTKSYTARIESVLPSIDVASRMVKVRLTDIHLPPYATLDSLVYGEIKIPGRISVLKVPSAAVVFHRNRVYVVRKSSEAKEAASSAVPVEVLSESSGSVLLRPQHEQDLKAGDFVSTKGAIFLLGKLIQQDPS